MKKPLKVMEARDSKLGRSTIMDRALATRYGGPYVHLAAFAIDVDRVREREDEGLPFAWEVFLTEAQLAQLYDSASHDPTPMLEEMCLAILEQPQAAGSEGPLGSQLPFAIYTGVARKLLPASLGQCFHAWKKPPVDLIGDVNALAAEPGLLAKLARHCLAASLQPPLVMPVREALEKLAARA